jgi:predicted CXXCH cytochrome family protein
VPALCLDCHEVDEEFADLHDGRAIGGSDCTACHDPHAAERPGLLRVNQHDPFAEGDCESCHGSANLRESFEIQMEIATLCMICHEDVEAEFEHAYHGHLSQDGSCVTCHNPHAADAEALLSARQSVLCMRCHFEEAAVRGDKERFLTHSAMDCDECHLPHGAENPLMLRSLGVELCMNCHEDSHSGGHPVGPQIIDSRTEKPVTCLSCHQMHGASFDFYLPLDPTMDLCIQCHKK